MMVFLGRSFEQEQEKAANATNMKIINKINSSKWGGLKTMPSPFQKCDHYWRELGENEKGESIASHECVICGLEKDCNWEPPMYGYQLKLMEVNEGVTWDEIEM